jgi:hypothetical protein
MESTDIDIINLFLKISFYPLLFNIKKIDLISLFKKMGLHLIDIKFNNEFSISEISKNYYNLEILSPEVNSSNNYKKGKQNFDIRYNL